MENKWEYDYSGLYQNGYQAPVQDSYQAPAGEPPLASPEPPSPPKPPKKHGRGKKIAACALALALMGTVSFGGAYAGYVLASKTTSSPVVFQSAASGSNTANHGTAGSLVDVSSAVSPSVVVVTTEQVVTTSGFWGGQQVVSGAGSGVVFTQDGYIVTNYHVVEGARQITVTLANEESYSATVVGSDSESDLALLKIEATGLTPAVLGDSDTVQVGETVIAVGNPTGNLGGTITDGIVSALNRNVTVEGNNMTLMQTSAAVSPGNSGGGLFNANGELIGIVNAKSNGEDAEGLGFAIPVNTVKTVVQDLLESGYVTGRPAFGITVISITDAQTAMQYGVSSLGVYVQSVDEGSGAQAAGMEVGDRIVSIGSKLVESTSDVTNALKDYAVGDVVEVQVDRGRELLTLNVTLGEKTTA